ncbi:MAG: bifunctional hydroxymethylpyrimidine kinase/phosphomethylpyrimidine kinase [Spirochaetaceae bacterium]|jgi:pyridoxine kinase|nr:bifunctional hydroxymethylpyrimidine kinase/phosphomethylpyrimidine kinase [Spirochaetaceae bacterium]
MIKVATIAGSDASGGAGLEADLKTFEEFGLYGMAAVTLIATMDPNNGWAHGVFPIGEAALRAQLETVFRGVGPAAVKSGMLGSGYAVDLCAEFIAGCGVRGYVLDPVMVCKGAGEALNPELNAAIGEKLLPLARVVTPNLFEAEQLSGVKNIVDVEGMKAAAKAICDRGARAVFVKGGAKLAACGGAARGRAVDVLFDGARFELVEGPLVDTRWTHGAGCTTAAAMCAGLAAGLSLMEAVRAAKVFVALSLSHSFALNEWVGPGNPSAWRVGFLNAKPGMR